MKTTTEALAALAARQEEMENHSLALGGQRFRKRLEEACSNGSEANVGAAKKLLTEGLDLVEKALVELVDTKKGRGRPHASFKWIRMLGPDVAAYLALKVVLDHVHSRVSVRKVAVEVTDLMIDELRFRRFKAEQPKLFEYALANFNTSSYAHKARSLDARIHQVDIDVSDLSLSGNDKFLVGVKLIDVVIQTTGLVKVEKQRAYDRDAGGMQDRVELVATDETIQWLDEHNGALENLFPVNLPMVMPPLPWGPGRKGGYRFGLRGKHRMVRSFIKKAGPVDSSGPLPVVYSALNRIQETPWSINQRVLDVVEQILAAGGGTAGLPLVNDEALPVKPVDIEENEVARKAWRKAAHLTHERNHDTRVHRSEVFRLLSIAKLVKDESAIWFPHNLDFRGRVYPVVNYLHPQGDDLTKALLQFAEGKPLGRDGAAYLAVHGANSLGKTREGAKLSKMTLQERIDYIVAISGDIMAVSADPLRNLWWADADDPWQFLAFCFDWAGFAAYDQEGRGEHYVSQLPVAADGTCNGLQHFSALWRDPVGGAAVNVMPSDKPQDIYANVAEVVLDRLEQSVTEPMASLWLRSGIVDRKLTKRPVMTFGYGSAQFGFAQQLREYVESHAEWNTRLQAIFSADVVDEKTGEVTTKSTLPAACTYMAGLIWQSLEVTVVAAFKGMAWMRECAKSLSKAGGQHVSWVVPGTGFPVVQTYAVEKVHRTTTTLAGTAFRPTIWEDTQQPSWKKQTSSVAPNVVHSLDAACLMLTVDQAAQAGIQHFAMVHDSYGTLAADAGLLASVTRQAFFGLYSQNDVVNMLWSQWTTQGGTKEDVVVPEPPPAGSMELSGVLASDYFFS